MAPFFTTQRGVVEVASAGLQCLEELSTSAVASNGTPWALPLARAIAKSLRCRSIRKPGANWRSIIF